MFEGVELLPLLHFCMIFSMAFFSALFPDLFLNVVVLAGKRV